MRVIPGRLSRIVRRFLRAPSFTTIAVLTLALGIGANTAIFSVIRGVLLKPLPFAEPDSLIAVWHTAPGLNLKNLELSAGDLLHLPRGRPRLRGHRALGQRPPFRSRAPVSPSACRRSSSPTACWASCASRRTSAAFSPAKTTCPERPERVILTHGYWQRKFGRDPGAIGRPIVVDGTPREIIGVLPADFRFLDEQPQLVLPLRIDRATHPRRRLQLPGDRAPEPGATIAQANADIARMIPLLVERFPLPPGFTKRCSRK